MHILFPSMLLFTSLTDKNLPLVVIYLGQANFGKGIWHKNVGPHHGPHHVVHCLARSIQRTSLQIERGK